MLFDTQIKQVWIEALIIAPVFVIPWLGGQGFRWRDNRGNACTETVLFEHSYSFPCPDLMGICVYIHKTFEDTKDNLNKWIWQNATTCIASNDFPTLVNVNAINFVQSTIFID